ncbi:CD1375 family protein [Fictibacillus sp. JL2B1089]
MATIYFKLIKAGMKTIDDVPQIHRAEVQEMLDHESSTEI